MQALAAAGAPLPNAAEDVHGLGEILCVAKLAWPGAEESETESGDCAKVFEMRMLPFVAKGCSGSLNL